MHCLWIFLVTFNFALQFLPWPMTGSISLFLSHIIEVLSTFICIPLHAEFSFDLDLDFDLFLKLHSLTVTVDLFPCFIYAPLLPTFSDLYAFADLTCWLFSCWSYWNRFLTMCTVLIIESRFHYWPFFWLLFSGSVLHPCVIQVQLPTCFYRATQPK